MNDYARVLGPKTKKKKQEKIVSSLLSHWKLPSFLVRRFAFFLRLFPFFFVFGFFSTRRDDQKEQRKKTKKRRKKKERRIGRHSILSDRFKQHEA